MNLSDVSKTAIITLRSRVIESERHGLSFSDPMARFCLDNLKSAVSGEGDDSVFNKKLPAMLTRHLAIRARKYDFVTNEFISQHPGCTVVSLGCGFDTRFWRIDNRNCEYIELDLPEVINVKKAILGEKLEYKLIGTSVLDISWIDEITEKSNQDILLIAEGLFMYLNKSDVIGLFKTISKSFFHSQIILEVITEKYTRGIWKKMVEMKMKNRAGSDAGSSYNFGIKNAREIETYGSGIKVIDEWVYFEDPDMRPKILKYMGMSRTQWTVTARIN